MQIIHSVTFLSALSGQSLKKLWCRSSRMLLRMSGFFCRQQKMKSLASLVSYTQEGILISSLIIFMSSSSLVILKGFSPTSISQAITPSDQMSIFSSYSLPFRISGPTQMGVPQKVVRRVCPAQTDQPKSHSFTTPSLRTMFSGLMSRWMMRCECSSFTAWHTCLMMPATFVSAIDWCFLICLKSCPPVPTSRMMQMFTLSSKNPYIRMMFGWLRKLWIFSSRMNCSVISSSFSSFFSITLSAHTKFSFLSRARYTRPYLPAPRSLIYSKSLMLIFFYFFLLQDFLTHSAAGSSCSRCPTSSLLFFMLPQLLLRESGDSWFRNPYYFDDQGLSPSGWYGAFFYFFSDLSRKAGILLPLSLLNPMPLDFMSGCSLIRGMRLGWVASTGPLQSILGFLMEQSESTVNMDPFMLPRCSRNEGTPLGVAGLCVYEAVWLVLAELIEPEEPSSSLILNPGECVLV